MRTVATSFSIANLSNRFRLWRSLDLEDLRMHMANQGAALDVMDLISYLQEEIKLKVVILLWCWSNVRNKTNQGERKYTTEELCSSVLYHSCQMTKLKSASSPSESKHGKWRPPREGFYKINCNGTFLQIANLEDGDT